MESLKALKVGDRYTIASFTLNGYPFKHSFIIREMEGVYEQGNLTIYTNTRNSRSLIKLHPRRQFIIWEGIVNPDVRIEAEIEVLSPTKVVKKGWAANNEHYMHRALKSVLHAPLICHIKPLNPANNRIFDILTIINGPEQGE